MPAMGPPGVMERNSSISRNGSKSGSCGIPRLLTTWTPPSLLITAEVTTVLVVRSDIVQTLGLGGRGEAVARGGEGTGGEGEDLGRCVHRRSLGLDGLFDQTTPGHEGRERSQNDGRDCSRDVFTHDVGENREHHDE